MTTDGIFQFSFRTLGIETRTANFWVHRILVSLFYIIAYFLNY